MLKTLSFIWLSSFKFYKNKSQEFLGIFSVEFFAINFWLNFQIFLANNFNESGTALSFKQFHPHQRHQFVALLSFLCALPPQIQMHSTMPKR